MGRIETSISDPRRAVLNSQSDCWGLGPTETCNSFANHYVFYAQNDSWGLVPIEICMLVQKSLFCMQKLQIKAGTHRDLSFWCKSRCLHAKTTDEGWDP